MTELTLSNHKKLTTMSAQSNTSTLKGKSQKELILWYLQHIGSIEPLTALREYGCYRLGARIGDLREEGYNITTERMSSKSKITGRTVQFARYTLHKAKAS